VDEGLDPSRIFVAPNAVDQEPVRQARAAWGDADLERFRRENRLEGRETISFLSRLDPSKRVDQLLEAFSVVVQARPNACLVLIGDGPERDRLQRMAKRLPPDSVRFVGALFTEAEIAPWLLSSRCFAYPRAIGLSIYHAFGFGLPVITCRPPGGHGPEIESLVDGVNGLLFAEGDVQGLAASLVAILGDEPLRRRLSAGAEATVHGEGGWDIPAMVSGFLHCFERVAGNSRQRQDGA
jgi:glycosyltransferase involved in cell wall biosynthesis